MLRITADETTPVLTYRLEGRLVGPWVRVLEECWQGALARRPDPVLLLDLTGVTSIDAAGKELLVALHLRGAEFVAADGLTNALVAEIVSGPDDERPDVNGRIG